MVRTAPQPYTSAWGAALPGGAGDDPSTVVVAHRVRAINPGRIVAIRYLRNLANEGEHIGLLYESSGTGLLRAKLFPYLAASGSGQGDWQTAYIRPFHRMAAGDVCVAAVWHQTGGYWASLGGLDGVAIGGPDVEFPADGDVGANGLYSYYTALTPTETYGSSAYSVDVLYLPDR